MLSSQDFIKAIELTQLVSIDLIVINEHGEVLVGRRKNEPAKGKWFVPGSRLLKNEKILDGINRVVWDELGYDLDTDKHADAITFLGIYDHIYPTNFMEKRDKSGELISTHYVVIGISLKMESDVVDEKVFKEQHSEMKWMSVEEAKADDEVHLYTKNYL